MIGPCCVRVYGPKASFKGSPCKGKPKVEVDGKIYCGIHDPAAVTRRQDRANQRYAAEQAIKNRRVADQKEMRRRADCYDQMLEALIAISAWMPTSTAAEGGASAASENVRAADLVRSAIKKATEA